MSDRESQQAIEYAASVEEAFATMHRVSAQLAGFALLNALKPAERDRQELSLRLIRQSLAEVEQALSSKTPPQRSAHCHHHLREAFDNLNEAAVDGGQYLLTAKREAAEASSRFHLKAAIDHLRHASNALPGLEMVDLSSACCAHLRPEALPS